MSYINLTRDSIGNEDSLVIMRQSCSEIRTFSEINGKKDGRPSKFKKLLN
ncbi:MAG: hypothetical protein ACRC1Z_05420 [Waterburya sp.]